MGTPRGLLLAVMSALAIAAACSTESGLEQRGVTFNALAAAGGRVIAAGTDGRVYISNDRGQSWGDVVWLSSTPLEAAYMDSNIEMAGGGSAVAQLLPNGWSGYKAGWSGETSVSALTACRGTRWVVGSGGIATYSSDGSNWSLAQGIAKGADLVDVACGRANVLVASYKQTSGHFISSDGKTFTNVTSPADTCAVAHAGNLYYTLALDGRLFTAPDEDAKSWTEIGRVPWPKQPVTHCTLVHAANMFCVAAGDMISCSVDGKTWTDVPLPERGPVHHIAMQDDGFLIACGPDRWVFDAQCSAGSCQPGKVRRAEGLQINKTPLVPPGGAPSSSSGGSSGTTCNGCTTDADCSALAQRKGVPGAACGPGGLCYPCFESCGAGGVNCRCIACSEPSGCGTDAVCTNGKLCAVQRDGKKPCE